MRFWKWTDISWGKMKKMKKLDQSLEGHREEDGTEQCSVERRKERPLVE